MTLTDKTIEINSLESGKSNDSRRVLNITRMTIHNGPGMRTLVLFKGCPLRCLWCSTPESQKTKPRVDHFLYSIHNRADGAGFHLHQINIF